MRKLLVVTGMGLFLMAMCVMPSMYGDNPCPQEQVNSNYKQYCKPLQKDQGDYITSHLNALGVAPDVQYCRDHYILNEGGGKAMCEKLKIAVSAQPDQSIGVKDPVFTSQTYIARLIDEVYIIEYEYYFATCFEYLTCDYVAAFDKCDNGVKKIYYQYTYGEFPCQ